MEELLEENDIKNRRLYLWDEIQSGNTFNIISRLEYFSEISKSPIQIIIHSVGGDTECAAAIIDCMVGIQKKGIEIKTIVLGTAYSAAADILAMGTKGSRYGRPNSAIMLHPCSFGVEEDYGAMNKANVDFVMKHSDGINRMICQACGVSNYNKFLQDIDKGLWLTAKDAVKYGVIDKILTGPLPFGG